MVCRLAIKVSLSICRSRICLVIRAGLGSLRIDLVTGCRKSNPWRRTQRDIITYADVPGLIGGPCPGH